MTVRESIVKLNICILLVATCVMCGCGKSNEVLTTTESPQKVDTGFVISKPGTYDSIDNHAVVVKIDKDNSAITFYNKVVKRKYTLEVDGTSKFYDKYGSSMVIDQINPGDVVDITFLKPKKKLNSLTISKDIWVLEGQKNFDIDTQARRIVLQDEPYRYEEKIFIFSDGQKADIMDLNSCDEITVRGYDHDIYSITVEKGHGYIRLKGDDYFLGGWVEAGKIIKTISDNMILTVPEDTKEIIISKDDVKGTVPVKIEKDKETLVDVSDLVTLDNTMFGTLIFALTPAEADVYIDGEQIETDKPFKTEYGVHQMIAKAPGYETMTQYIKVGQENATLDITLEEIGDRSERPSAAPSPTPMVTTYVTPAVVTADTSSYKVTIEAPEGAEVYVDGSYVGVVPASFPKSAGTHVVTLRKEGFVTRSYTITLDSLLQNETFSFSLLTEDK